MTGNIIAFSIWSIITLVFIIIGISDWNSKKAVGFYTGVKPPEVKDIKKYNRAVAKIWFVYAAGFELLALFLLFYEQNSPMFIIPILGVVFLTIGIIVAYNIVLDKNKAGG